MLDNNVLLVIFHTDSIILTIVKPVRPIVVLDSRPNPMPTMMLRAILTAKVTTALANAV